MRCRSRHRAGAGRHKLLWSLASGDSFHTFIAGFGKIVKEWNLAFLIIIIVLGLGSQKSHMKGKVKYTDMKMHTNSHRSCFQYLNTYIYIIYHISMYSLDVWKVGWWKTVQQCRLYIVGLFNQWRWGSHPLSWPPEPQVTAVRGRHEALLAPWPFTWLYLAPAPVTSTSPDQTASLRYSLQQTFSPHSKVPPWTENIFSSKSKNQNYVEQAGGRWVIRPSEGKQQQAQPLIRCLGIHHKFCVHSRNLVAAHLASCHPTTDSIYFYLGQIFLSTITKIFIYLPHHI